MLYFRTGDNSYHYFAHEVDGQAYVHGLWMNGLKVQHDHKSTIRNQKNTGLRDACLQVYKDKTISFEEISTLPGTYHPRIWRGPWSPIEKLATLSEETRSVVATSVLVERLRQVFRYVEPALENDRAFGHEIRNVHMLAAMEVEAGFAAVLKANGYPGERWGISDYVSLKDHMFLNNYRVRLVNYPDYPAFVPFEGWDADRPGKTLPWWEAYNATKHNRDLCFDQSSLKNAVRAVGAAVILLFTQFGSIIGRQGAGSIIATEFEVEPVNTYPDDFPAEFFYVPETDAALPGQRWVMKKIFEEE